ncbi:unnamed protein product [Symbiodinium sp. KB8]|nr:unnamed protein product [Symbiodinium sp. KB8]
MLQGNSFLLHLVQRSIKERIVGGKRFLNMIDPRGSVPRKSSHRKSQMMMLAATGFWNEYLVFPATLQSIEWLSGQPQNSGTRDLSPMSVRTADGLMVELGIVAQYTVVREKIPQIYQTYKTEYEGFFISNLRSALQSTVAEFKATELYTDRFKVQGGGILSYKYFQMLESLCWPSTLRPGTAVRTITTKWTCK